MDTPTVNPPSITTTFTYRIPGPVVVRDTIHVERHTELHSVTVTYCDGVEVDWDVEGWHLSRTGEHRGNRRRCFPPLEVIDPYLVDARQRMAPAAADRYERLGATAEQAERWAENPHDDDAAYEAHLAAELERMCPEVRAMETGFADPMTAAYGAGDVVADAIGRHVRRCEHPWCQEQS